ncbi:MAG: hypothetical protein OQK82_06030 [Candidatus Pacearchaeota archaeon]|nr:hypothetical protein [Candidatus Pacearchaeota archaeon]
MKTEIIIYTITLVILFFIAWYIRLKFIKIKKDLAKTSSQLKSAYVRFGKSFEHFVPFTKKFKGDLEKTVFLGMPIDFICFDKDKIKFIEVKTGNSKLSQKQKFIKKQIEEGKVEFMEVRY